MSFPRNVQNFAFLAFSLGTGSVSLTLFPFYYKLSSSCWVGALFCLQRAPLLKDIQFAHRGEILVLLIDKF